MQAVLPDSTEFPTSDPFVLYILLQSFLLEQEQRCYLTKLKVL